MKKILPLIKEYRIDKLIQILNCFDKFPFNRDSLRENILNLYSSTYEKSIFRGMVIPSLRHLGLILGYDEDLRLSANGNLIVVGNKKSSEEGLRIFRAVLAEMDNTNLKILKLINQKNVSFNKLKTKLVDKIEAPSEKQARERVNHWISMLINTELLIKVDDTINISKNNTIQVENDLDFSSKQKKFRDIFFNVYKAIFKKQGNIAILDITEIRTEVALTFFRNSGLVLTEQQFDSLLREISFVTDEYIISLGRAMGAEEKVFEHENNYYRTVSIRFLK